MLMESLTRRKRLDPRDSTHLDRTLGTFDLTLLGIGSTLGVGIYVLAGTVALTTGPSVVLSFCLAGLASGLSGLCYAELAARVPRAGSAYVYSYATVGEFVAFVIGWNLVLEYAIGVASVSKGFSGYLDSLCNGLISSVQQTYFPLPDSVFLASYIDILSFLLVSLMTLLLCFGVKTSTNFNSVFTCLNLALVTFVTTLGLLNGQWSNWQVDPDNPPLIMDARSNDEKSLGAVARVEDAVVGAGGFFPFGLSATLSGAATCFYGYVGFDVIATSGEETKNPKRSLPLSIALSLTAISLAYIGVSSAITLMIPYYVQDENAPLPFAFKAIGLPWAATIVTWGALLGLTTSLIGAIFPLPRVLYAMASDKLIFEWLGKVSERTQVPIRATVVGGAIAGLTAAVFDLKALVDMMSIGTLMAYSIVAACVILLRYENVPGLDGQGEYEALDKGASKSFNPNDFYAIEDDDDSDSGEEIPMRLSSEDRLSEDRSQRRRGPNPKSTKRAILMTIVFCLLVVVSAGVGQITDEYLVLVPTQLVLFVLMLATLISLSRLPETTQVVPFKVSLVPYLPGLCIVINILLMSKLSLQTWTRFTTWMILGALIYFGYGIRHSRENKV